MKQKISADKFKSGISKQKKRNPVLYEQIDWSSSGLIDSIPDKKKDIVSQKLNETRAFLIERNGGDEFETLAFPFIIRSFKESEDFDTVSLIKEFLEDYEKNVSLIKEFLEDYEKVDLQAEYLVGWISNKFKK